MEMNAERLKNLWEIVEKAHKQVLVMNFLGEFKAYVVNGFATKTRDNPFNEAYNAIDITDLSINLPILPSELNSQSFDEKIRGRSVKDFKFGGDDYFWLIKSDGGRNFYSRNMMF